MSKFIYSTSESFNGPWLIDKEALSELDKVIDDAYEILNTSYEQFLDQMTENDVNESIEIEKKFGELKQERLEDIKKKSQERIKRYYRPLKKSISLEFAQSKKLDVNSFSEAMRDNSLINEKAIGFKIKLDTYNDEISIIVGNWRNNLEIESSPESSEISKELFMHFRNWAIKYQAPKWQQIWQNLNGQQWAVWMILLLVTTFIMSVQLDSGINRQTRQQATQLLENGLQSEEIAETIELLLSREVSYSPQINTKKPIPNWYIIFFFVSLIITIILTYPPKIILGIGKGTTSIYQWRLWIKFISITIPLGIFSIIIIPIFQEYLFGLLK